MNHHPPSTPSFAEASFMSIEGDTPPDMGKVAIELSPQPEDKKRLLTKSTRAGNKRQRVMEHAASVLKLASDLKARLAAHKSSSPLKRALDEELRAEANQQALIDLSALEQVWADSTARTPRDFFGYRDRLLEFASRCSLPEAASRARSLAVEVGKAGEQLERQVRAEMHKLRGNESYKAGDFGKAEDEYRQACVLEPCNAVYAANRGAALLMQGRLGEALSEGERAIQLDPTYARGYLRCARASLSLGDATSALRRLEQASGLGTALLQGEARAMVALAHQYLSLIQQADAALAREDAREAERLAIAAQALAPGSTRVRLIAACARMLSLAQSGSSPEACQLALRSVLGDVEGCPAGELFRYALLLFRRALRSEAQALLQVAARKDPGSAQVQAALATVQSVDRKLREAARLQAEARLDDALALLGQALTLDPPNDALNGRILYQRAGLWLLAGRPGKAEDDCVAALGKLPSYDKARLRLARAMLSAGNWHKAGEELARLEGKLKDGRLQQEWTQLWQQVAANKRHEQQENRPIRNAADLYSILGVAPSANKDEIRKAYKKGALRLHPDKNPGKASAEEDFKRLVEAFNVLSSPSRRRAYDVKLRC